MMELLPEGKSIGHMQAPPEWIFSHTVRFVGLVRIAIHDGEGFILVKKGKALVYYFKHGQIELKGHSALEYFQSHQTLDFKLCKYTPEEFSTALRILNIDDEEPDTGEGVPSAPEKRPHSVVHRNPSPPLKERSKIVPEPPTESGEPLDPDARLIHKMKDISGILAVSVFDEDRHALLAGQAGMESYLGSARGMLKTAKKIMPLLNWGSFVHMTLQVPEGNVIIAPYYDQSPCSPDRQYRPYPPDSP
jgi:hypothetical protein